MFSSQFTAELSCWATLRLTWNWITIPFSNPVDLDCQRQVVRCWEFYFLYTTLKEKKSERFAKSEIQYQITAESFCFSACSADCTQQVVSFSIRFDSKFDITGTNRTNCYSNKNFVKESITHSCSLDTQFHLEFDSIWLLSTSIIMSMIPDPEADEMEKSNRVSVSFIKAMRENK